MLATAVGAQAGAARSEKWPGASSNLPPPAEPVAAFARLLEDRVFARLAQRDALADIDVTATRDIVTLTGTVAREHAWRRAPRIARQTPGVRDVEDRLEVRPPDARQSRVADSVLAQRVAEEIVAAIPRAKAGADWWSAGWRVEGEDNGWSFVVESDGGAVTLQDNVRRYDILRKAVEAARAVDGVRNVRSGLEVEPFYSFDPYFYGYRYGYPYGYPEFAYGPYWVP